MFHEVASEKAYTDHLEEIATFGLEGIDPGEKVEVNLKDLMYVFSILQEYRRLFRYYKRRKKGNKSDHIIEILSQLIMN